MKKFFILFLFVAVVSAGLIINATQTSACCTYPDGTVNGDSDDCSDWVPPTPPPVEEEVIPEEVASGGIILHDKIEPVANYSITAIGQEVTATWLTTNKMTTQVNVSCDNGFYKEYTFAPATYHDVTFYVDTTGVCTVQPQSEIRNNVYKGAVRDVTLTADYPTDENGGDENFFPFKFKNGLLYEQMQTILELYFEKDIDDWTDVDYKNWLYAVLN